MNALVVHHHGEIEVDTDHSWQHTLWRMALSLGVCHFCGHRKVNVQSAYIGIGSIEIHNIYKLGVPQ